MPITDDRLLLADRLGKRLAKGNTDVFYSVMGINGKVALSPDLQVDQAMPGDLIKHMVEKGNAGVQVLLSRAIKTHFHRDMGLSSFTRDLSGSHTAMIQFAP